MAFEGKVVLVTGASSGIGAACAEYFAEQKALVALVGRNAEKFQNVVKKIKENGVKKDPLVILADVSTDAKRIINDTIGTYGRLDVLINNAGIASYGSIENTTLENFDAVMGTNVRGVFELTQLAVPYLTATKGNVINVSSVAGIKSFPGNLAYCISKSALDQFTKCVALELADKGVRVNSVNPGTIVTDFLLRNGISKEDLPEALEKRVKIHPLGRLGQSSEVVNAITFLANDSANFVTGICLPVDGGAAIK